MKQGYIVEAQPSVEELAYEVSMRMEEGYTPTGGFFVREWETPEGYLRRVYYQPLILTAQPPSHEEALPEARPDHS